MFETHMQDSDLDRTIASAFSQLSHFTADSDEYAKILSQLSDLYALKNVQDQHHLQTQKASAEQQLAQDQNAWQEEQDQRPFYKRVDPTAALTVAGNLAVAFVVVNYEQRGVISTRVTNFLMKHL